jgi:YD repeat-containing protein
MPSFKPGNISIVITIAAIALLQLASCSVVNNEDAPAPECYLEEIRYDEFNSLRFQTISGGQLYRISRLFTVDGEVNVQADYRFNYSKDTLTVLDRTLPFANTPFMAIAYENEEPRKVARYFYSSGVTLFHDISYFEEDRIRIDLSRLDSTGDLLYVGYAIYHLNDRGNVIRNERFRADMDDSTLVTKIEDRTFTYDTYPSPQEDLLVPYFGNAGFPDVQYFSANNILTFSENNQTFEYRYEYGPDDNVITQTVPQGQSVSFSYANCSEE